MSVRDLGYLGGDVQINFYKGTFRRRKMEKTCPTICLSYILLHKYLTRNLPSKPYMIISFTMWKNILPK